jgi:hypothetical protein
MGRKGGRHNRGRGQDIVASWKRAVSLELADRLGEVARRPPPGCTPHWGYTDGEIPCYSDCACGQQIRADRLDLVLEHLELCPA